ncbi:MAG TPA: pyruvate kinase [Firmicutes bacterium]|nr:pyruvate kinase [Bacillota bacterium]
MRKTKIVCTIGPASESKEMIRSLLLAGMNVARLNFSHGDKAEHLSRIKTIRETAAELGVNAAILLDVQGPKIRIGSIKPGFVNLEPGQTFTLTVEPCEGNETKAFVDYPYLNRDLKPGSVIYIDDGLLELKVAEISGPNVICRVITGGELSSRKGLSLPGVDVDLPPITKEDEDHIRFGIAHDVDFIAISFVRKGEHVRSVRKIIREAGGTQQIISKIESDAGLRNIDDIIAASDGIMVARGDLGVEISTEEVPLAQKMLIRKCNLASKPVITATQMLDSMIRNPRPTRAEVTDVSSAIFDGTDCVMLSGETAVGKYPVRSVQVMAKIARRMEQVLDYHELLAQKTGEGRTTIDQAISLAACQATQDLGLNAIICSTASGQTARSVSQKRPKAVIFAASPNDYVVRQLALVWGVYPVKVEATTRIEEMINNAVTEAKARGIVKTGDVVTIVAGVKIGVAGGTNLLQIHNVE